MGKPKHPVWSLFHTLDKGVKCKYCAKVYAQGNVFKMARHIAACLSCPKEMKKLASRGPKEVSVQISTSAPSSSSSSNTTSVRTNTAEVRTTAHKRQSSSFPSFVDHMDAAENESLNQSFAEAVYVTGSNLSMVEHPAWIEFFSKLRPAYKLPTRYQVSNTYLDAAYAETQSTVTKQLNESQALNLQCDGWSNCRNESVINFIICNPEPFFVEFKITGEKKHDAPYLASLIDEILQKYDVSKFVVLIGDNASNIRAAFKIIKEKYPHIITLGCLAHLLHLLCSDIIKCESVKKFFEDAVGVVKSIKKSHILQAVFDKIRKQKKIKSTLKLPGKTRWGSHLYCLESLKQNKPTLQTLAVSEDTEISEDLKKKLLDDSGFWKNVDILIIILEPIVSLLKMLESDESMIYMVFQKFQLLGEILRGNLSLSVMEVGEQEHILDKYDERREFGLGPIHLAADLLSPSSQGNNLSPNELIDAIAFICEMAQRMNIDSTLIKEELADFRDHKGHWSKSFLWEDIDKIHPLVWWRNIRGVSKLGEVALKILGAPVTSAATERSFKTFSFIHCQKRNRLTTTRAGKISYVAHNYKLRNRKAFPQRQKRKRTKSKAQTSDPKKSRQDGPSTSDAVNQETELPEDEILESSGSSDSNKSDDSDSLEYDTEDLCDDSLSDENFSEMEKNSDDDA